MATIYVDPLNGTDNGDAGRGEGEGTDAYASIAYALANYGSFSSTEGNTIYLADTAADVLSASLDCDTSVATVESPLAIVGYHYDGSNGGSAGAITATLPWGRTVSAGEIDGNDAVAQIIDTNTSYTTLRRLKMHSVTGIVISLYTNSRAVECEIYDGGTVRTVSGSGRGYFIWCTIRHTTGGGNGVYAPARVEGCEISDHDEGVLIFLNYSGIASGNLIHGITDAGIQVLGDGITVEGNTIDGSGAATDAIGVEMTSANVEGTNIYNNLITNFSGASAKAIYAPTGSPCATRGNNAFYNNSTDNDTPAPANPITDVTESGDPYTDAASDDFSLDSGASSIGAAIITNADPDNPDNIGAWQDYSSGGGGATPGMTAHVTVA